MVLVLLHGGVDATEIFSAEAWAAPTSLPLPALERSTWSVRSADAAPEDPEGGGRRSSELRLGFHPRVAPEGVEREVGRVAAADEDAQRAVALLAC